MQKYKKGDQGWLKNVKVDPKKVERRGEKVKINNHMANDKKWRRKKITKHKHRKRIKKNRHRVRK